MPEGNGGHAVLGGRHRCNVGERGAIRGGPWFLATSTVRASWRDVARKSPRPARPGRLVVPVRRPGATWRARSSTTADSLPNSPLFYVRGLRLGSQISPRRTSRRFRLTPHLAELAGNSQMLPERGSLGTRRACLSASPKALSRPFRARVSQSPERVRVWLTGGSALESPPAATA